MIKDNVTLYSNCYTYYLNPLIRKFRTMRDDKEVSFKELQQEVLNSITEAQNTPAKARFISRVLADSCFTKLHLCQLVENSCDAGKRTRMIHYSR